MTIEICLLHEQSMNKFSMDLNAHRDTTTPFPITYCKLPEIFRIC